MTTFTDHPTMVATAKLEAIRRTEDRTRQDRIRWISRARDVGMTWQQIGDALGMTKAGARNFIIRETTKGA